MASRKRMTKEQKMVYWAIFAKIKNEEPISPEVLKYWFNLHTTRRL